MLPSACTFPFVMLNKLRPVARNASSLCLVIATFYLASGWPISANAAKPERPNIIVIMADDMGYECVEANGGTSYKTPHLNKLAATGMRFEHGYSQPICTPSRVQIMTGIYNQRNYIRFGVLDPNQKTFAHFVKEAGYKTCIAGKWQLEGGLKGPNKFGFDEYALWQLTRRPSRYPNPGLEVNGKEIDYPEKYGPDIASDYICDFITRHKDEDFFVYYPMILPHWPFEPTPDSEEWDPKSKGAGNSQKNTKFFVDMVNYTDKMVGKIVTKLDELGLRENTLVIFTGDNGTATSVTSMMGDKKVKGGKGTTKNAGTHVPFIANWPGTIKPNQVTQDLVDFSDILPTVVEAAGASIPIDHKIDGKSFYKVLTGEEKSHREWTYCWYARNGGKIGQEFARDQNFKLYRTGELYDIANDELEQNNLLTAMAETSGEAAIAHSKLQKVLDDMADTRIMLPEPYKKKNNKKQNDKNATNKTKKEAAAND